MTHKKSIHTRINPDTKRKLERFGDGKINRGIEITTLAFERKDTLTTGDAQFLSDMADRFEVFNSKHEHVECVRRLRHIANRGVLF